MVQSYAFLGPAATFTEAALLQLLDQLGESTSQRVPVANAEAALAGVAHGTYSGAVVPIENSLEGGVPATLDALTHHGQLRIVAETVVRVQFVLAAVPGTRLADIRTISTHPHAEAQTREWVAANLAQVDYVPASSTAAAARMLGDEAQHASTQAHSTALSETGSTGVGSAQSTGTEVGMFRHTAVVCTALAAELYGLSILARDIGTARNAQTRFILVRRPGLLPPVTGADKTTIVASLTTNRAGALLELLEQLATRGVNLSRIESRPTGDGLGLYKFSMDIAGHILEPRVAEALKGAHRVVKDMQFLGSYPASDKKPIDVEPTATSAAFDGAEAWLAELVSDQSAL